MYVVINIFLDVIKQNVLFCDNLNSQSTYEFIASVHKISFFYFLFYFIFWKIYLSCNILHEPANHTDK